MSTRAGAAYLDVEADFDQIVAEFARNGRAAGAAFEAAFDADLDLDTAGADVKLAALEARLTAMDSPTIRIDVDSAGALVQIAAVGASLAALPSGGGIDLGGGGAAQGLQGVAVAGVAVVAVLALIGPAVALITALAIPLVAILGALALGFGVVVAAIGPVIAAYAGLQQSEQQAAAASARRAQEEKAKTEAIAQASEAEQRATEALVRARENAAESAERNARRVSDAERSVTDARKQAADAAESAARTVEAAERSLQDAQRASLSAQESVNEARRQAAEDLRDLQDQVAGQGLREDQAAVDVEKARERLNRASTGQQAFSSYGDQLQAQLDLRKAQARQDQIKKEGAEQRSALAEATRLGVEGSKRVQSAKDAERAAVQRVSDAERSLGDAREAQIEAQRVGSQRIADAQRAVADAVRDAQRAQVSAQNGVSDALRAQASAQDDLREAQNRTITDVQRTASAFDDLPPAGQRFVRFLQGEFVPGVKRLFGEAMTGFLPGLQRAMQNLAPLTAPLGNFLRTTGKLLGDLLVRASEALTAPFWTNFFKQIGDFAQGALREFLPALGGLVTGFASLISGMISNGSAKALLDWVTGMVSRLGEFFAQFAKSDSFDRFMDYVVNQGPATAAALGDLIKGFVHIVAVLGDGPGGGLIGLIGALGGLLAALPADLIYMIAGAFFGLAIAFLAVNAPVVLIVAAITLLVAGIKHLWDTNKGFRDWITGAWDRIVGVFQGAGRLITQAWEGVVRFFTVTIPNAVRTALEWLGKVTGLGGGSITVGGGGGGWKGGGYTGDGDPDEVAGPAHRGEFYFSAPATRLLGVPLLAALHSAALAGRRPALGEGFMGGGFAGAERGRSVPQGSQGALAVRLSDEDRALLSSVGLSIDGRKFATITRGIADRGRRR